jgi:DnaJ-class molecular chaperone
MVSSVRGEIVEGVRWLSSNHDGTHYRQPTSRVASGTDYYALLEVHRHLLTAGDLKAAYYRLAKQYHPDALSGMSAVQREVAQKKFAQIGVAYHVLSDPKRRQEYDIFVDLSSVGDQDRMLHWVKVGDASRHDVAGHLCSRCMLQA